MHLAQHLCRPHTICAEGEEADRIIYLTVWEDSARNARLSVAHSLGEKKRRGNALIGPAVTVQHAEKDRKVPAHHTSKC